MTLHATSVTLRRIAVAAGSAVRTAGRRALRLLATVLVRLSAPQQAIGLDAATAGGVRRVFWFDDTALIGAHPPATGRCPGVQPPQAFTSSASSTTTADPRNGRLRSFSPADIL
jgi:hypothetical protein